MSYNRHVPLRVLILYFLQPSVFLREGESRCRGFSQVIVDPIRHPVTNRMPIRCENGAGL